MADYIPAMGNLLIIWATFICMDICFVNTIVDLFKRSQEQLRLCPYELAFSQEVVQWILGQWEFTALFFMICIFVFVNCKGYMVLEDSINYATGVTDSDLNSPESDAPDSDVPETNYNQANSRANQKKGKKKSQNKNQRNNNRQKKR